MFDRWIAAQHAVSRPPAPVRQVHEQLLADTFDVPGADTPVRRMAITRSGVPIVYSHKCGAGSAAPAYRILAEPGGPGVEIPHQVAICRRLLHSMLGTLGWSAAAPHVERVLAEVIPADPGAIDRWWGGLGVGLQAGGGSTELRVYANVRHGEAGARWDRLARVLAAFGGNLPPACFHPLRERLEPIAVPAGVGLAIRSGAVCAARIYLGMLRPCGSALVHAAPAELTRSVAEAARMVDTFAEGFGIPEQGVALAYDFSVMQGVLQPVVARFKAEISCEPVSDDLAPTVLPWLAEWLRRWNLDPRGLGGFVGAIEEAFPGTRPQYLSIGIRDVIEEVAVYVEPGSPAA